jgi:hypothetical protein
VHDGTNSIVPFAALRSQRDLRTAESHRSGSAVRVPQPSTKPLSDSPAATTEVSRSGGGAGGRDHREA